MQETQPGLVYLPKCKDTELLEIGSIALLLVTVGDGF